jgi:hypothetical protein
MIFLQGTAPKLPGAPAPAQAVPSKPATPNITNTIPDFDFLDVLGVGTWANAAVMSALALFCGWALLIVQFYLCRKAYGSEQEMADISDKIERSTFDLGIREHTAIAKISGLKQQIAAVEANLVKVR